ncbi:MAG: DoxX family membrane protein [Gammaproteobacteria bacterium]|nr:DoxX family membrane protein [Gammaproteobacteria bacterium]MCH9764271.1 DoxX family membrane protein [Gammaproteobacteria bacterium]
MDTIHLFAPSLGAFLVGFYFVFFGVWNACHWSPTKQVMSLKKIPSSALILSIGITFQIILGSLLMLGIYIQFAAIMLMPFTLIASFIFHDFWASEGELWRLNFIIFTSNLTCSLGALCLLAGGNI